MGIELSVLHLMPQSAVECHANVILGQIWITNSCQASRRVSVCNRILFVTETRLLRLVAAVDSVVSQS